MRFRSPLCDLFDIEHPILLAGMGGGSGPELAAAVSNAGGLGVLGAAACSPEQLDDWITQTRKLTDRPFGVDTLLPASVPQNMQSLADDAASGKFDPMSLVPAEVLAARDEFMRREDLSVPERMGALSERMGFVKDFFSAQLDVVLDHGVALYVSGLGVPSPAFISAARGKGMKVMGVAGQTRHARKLVDGGVDGVVAQGHDGGGHNSPIGTMALLPQVVDAVAGAVPVIGAGGISDGRGIAAALILGCSGVWIGTRFLATPESGIPQFQKEAIDAAADKDTLVSKSMTGKPARMLRGKWAEEYEQGRLQALPMPLQSMVSGPVMAAAMVGGRADVWPGFAGQGAGLVGAIKPAGEVMAELVAEAVAALEGCRSIPGLEVSA
jgi:NAD(P)H-dependent flavin oxidoreductase YrpB (nitropropane dioxygenase family)